MIGVMLELRSYAKINLALSVGPAVSDPPERAGFHPIASWFAAVDLADVITLERSVGGSRFEVVWADGRAVDWPLERDLFVRAHAVLESVVGRELPTRARVVKRIPAGGGLGGGSSNAAAGLRGIAALHGLDIDDAAMRRLAASIGSDVGFFLDLERGLERAPRAAVVTGFGETVERVDAAWERGSAVTLLAPTFGCSTVEVYRAFDATGTKRLREADVRALAAGPGIDPSTLFNDLAGAAESVEPRLRGLRERVETMTGERAHVSGSGSTLFTFSDADLSSLAMEGVVVTRCEFIGDALRGVGS
ncbi:MAG: hypothetical protein CMJ31_00610 [Phycisphaerae bacterium]|nr:hypothetical protein [Phycisphaerae bacterium]